MVIQRGRGSTGPANHAVLPPGHYAADDMDSRDRLATSVLRFEGEDGRVALFAVDTYPLPGWRNPVVTALGAALGPTGSRRTVSSARGFVSSVRWMLIALEAVPDPPATPEMLQVSHLESVVDHWRTVGASEDRGWRCLAQFGRLLMLDPLRGVVAPEVIDFTRRRLSSRGVGRPGYSDGELARVVSAARADVAALRDRIRAAERQIGEVDRLRSGPDHAKTVALAEMAQTGIVPRPPGPAVETSGLRRDLAGTLFLTIPDLAPLLVLFVALTGRNIETIKELPHEHRILENRAVEIRLTKRRRHAGAWFDTATWEIGPPGRELHHPGGLYLLLHELTRRGRIFSNSGSIWSVWRSGQTRRAFGPDEHFDPFARDLNATSVRMHKWRDRHRLVADAVDGETALPLEVTGNRIRTSVEVRRTRQMGGHLPSAARSNTAPVLFRNYLRGDPTVQEWAHEVIGAAVADAEAHALDAHRRALEAAGGGLQVVSSRRDVLPGTATPPGVSEATDTAWSACTDITTHPTTGRACTLSFLDCFHCGNCVVTTDHLPRLIGLLDALASRRQHMTDPQWWTRYGPAWAAIRHDILPKFSRAEINAAAQAKSDDDLLNLVEAPWEHP